MCEHSRHDLKNVGDKFFKSGLSKFCGRQPLKNLKGYGLLKFCLTKPYPFNFLKTLCYKMYLVHS